MLSFTLARHVFSRRAPFMIVGLGTGLSVGAYYYHHHHHNTIACQEIPPQITRATASQADSSTINQVGTKFKYSKRQRFAIYRQLTFGSISGVFLGYLTGQIAKIIVGVGVALAVMVQLLVSKGIIKLSSPLPSSGPSDLDDESTRQGSMANKILTKVYKFSTINPPFEASFISCFVIAALYA